MRHVYTVTVTQTTDVEIRFDDSEMDEKFLQEFRASYYDFENLDEHAKHLASLKARGLWDDFIEGYGEVSNVKSGDPQIRAQRMWQETETEIMTHETFGEP